MDGVGPEVWRACIISISAAALGPKRHSLGTSNAGPDRKFEGRCVVIKTERLRENLGYEGNQR
jgi:hypothetical protein